MSEKKRRWFQIHLSTAILAVLAFGTLLTVETAMSDILNAQIAEALRVLQNADSVRATGPIYILPCLFLNAIATIALTYFLELRIRRREARAR